MPNNVRADMRKVNRMISEVENVIVKREGELELVNKLIGAENLLTYCVSRLENAVVPPCKVGDTLYVISQTRDKRILPFINEYKATSIKLGKKKCVVYHEVDGYIKIFKQDDFGKTVFLTREEADKALKGGVDNGE